MKRPVRALCLVLMAGTLCAPSGCRGVTHNPAYFPHVGIFGDIQPTHAKPGDPSYYSNFDPHAARLEVRDRKSTRLNSSPLRHLVCRLLLEKKKDGKNDEGNVKRREGGARDARVGGGAEGRPLRSAPNRGSERAVLAKGRTIDFGRTQCAR